MPARRPLEVRMSLSGAWRHGSGREAPVPAAWRAEDGEGAPRGPLTVPGRSCAFGRPGVLLGPGRQIRHPAQQRGAAGRDAGDPGETGTGLVRQIAPVVCRSRSVTRPWRRVGPGTCSTNVRRPHAVAVQKNRRSRKASCALRPVVGRAAGNRRQELWTRSVQWEQSGQAAPVSVHRASTRTTSPSACTVTTGRRRGPVGTAAPAAGSTPRSRPPNAGRVIRTRNDFEATCAPPDGRSTAARRDRLTECAPDPDSNRHGHSRREARRSFSRRRARAARAVPGTLSTDGPLRHDRPEDHPIRSADVTAPV